MLGTIGLTVILVVTVYQLRKLWKWLQLKRFGVLTQGKIVGLPKEDTVQGYRYYIIYCFDASSVGSGTNTIEQKQPVNKWLYYQFTVGQQVLIKYLPSNPELSKLFLNSYRVIIHSACKIIFLLALLNFGLFIVNAMFLGGDALNGKVEGGRYFLSNHGVYTEVNYFVFTYSKLHAISLFITHPLAILAAFVHWATGGGARFTY